jgi:hypothetical protein
MARNADLSGLYTLRHCLVFVLIDFVIDRYPVLHLLRLGTYIVCLIVVLPLGLLSQKLADRFSGDFPSVQQHNVMPYSFPLWRSLERCHSKSSDS